MWFTQTMGYVHKEIASPFIKVQKDEGIKPAAKPLHFLFTLSQFLSHNHGDCLQCYNFLHNCVTMLSFIGEIPWENTAVNCYQPKWKTSILREITDMHLNH